MKILRSKYLSPESLKRTLESKYSLKPYPLRSYIKDYRLFAGNLKTLSKIPRLYGFICPEGKLYLHPDALLRQAKKEWKAMIEKILTRKTSENSNRGYLQ